MILRNIVDLIRKYSPYANRLKTSSINLDDDSVDNIWRVIEQLHDGHTTYTPPIPSTIKQNPEYSHPQLPTWDIFYAKQTEIMIGALDIPSLPPHSSYNHVHLFTRTIRDALTTFMKKSVQRIEINLLYNYGGFVDPFMKGISVLFKDRENTIMYGTVEYGTTTYHRADGSTTEHCEPQLTRTRSKRSIGATKELSDCDIPIDILVGSHTASAGELVAVILDTLPNATIIGTSNRTGGCLTPTISLTLANGGILSVCSGELVSRYGTVYDTAITPSVLRI